MLPEAAPAPVRSATAVDLLLRHQAGTGRHNLWQSNAPQNGDRLSDHPCKGVIELQQAAYCVLRLVAMRGERKRLWARAWPTAAPFRRLSIAEGAEGARDGLRRQSRYLLGESGRAL
jgi:hypothetical protein